MNINEETYKMLKVLSINTWQEKYFSMEILLFRLYSRERECL